MWKKEKSCEAWRFSNDTLVFERKKEIKYYEKHSWI